MRSLAVPQTFQAYVDCYAPRLKPGQRFGGMTAAREWGLPTPKDWKKSESIDVIVPPSGAVPRTAGVQGRRLREGRAETRTLRGLPVIDPVATLFTCAKDLTLGQAVAMIDALVTTASDYPGLMPAQPMSTREEIARRLEEWGRFPGSGIIRAALPMARERVESPKETETRLVIIDSGLPEPVVQFEVFAGRTRLGRIDLAYPQWKIAIEYEGDHHRTSKDQWRTDIQRQRHLEGEGWAVIRLTQADLDDPRLFLARLHHEIATRR